jgi:hypothetical protein
LGDPRRRAPAPSSASAATAEPGIFSTAEAAAYLGLKPASLRYHIYVAKDLRPDFTVGRTFAFTRETLDKFAAEKRPAHRPRKSRE